MPIQMFGAFVIPIFLSLTILRIRITPCTAILCDRVLPEQRAPQPDHCTHILAHLPDFPPNIPTAVRTNGQTLVDPSSLLDPNAHFLYQSCFIIFEIHSPFMRTLSLSSSLRLSQSRMIESWRLLRDTAVDKKSVCVGNNQKGSGGVGSFYHVRVARPPQGIARRQAYLRRRFERVVRRADRAEHCYPDMEPAIYGNALRRFLGVSDQWLNEPRKVSSSHGLGSGLCPACNKFHLVDQRYAFRDIISVVGLLEGRSTRILPAILRQTVLVKFLTEQLRDFILRYVLGHTL